MGKLIYTPLAAIKLALRGFFVPENTIRRATMPDKNQTRPSKSEVVKKTERKQQKKRGGNPNPAPGPGRPKGVPNKISGLAKNNIAKVFDEIGGVPRMCEWALANQTEFYKLYARLVPVQVTGDAENPIAVADVTAKVLSVMTPEQLEEARKLALLDADQAE
jgi:hypothetical protein